MVGTYVSNSEPWGCSGSRVMTIFVSYVSPHFPHIGYFGEYEGIWLYMEALEGIWRYIKVYESIRKYMKVHRIYRKNPSPSPPGLFPLSPLPLRYFIPTSPPAAIFVPNPSFRLYPSIFFPTPFYCLAFFTPILYFLFQLAGGPHLRYRVPLYRGTLTNMHKYIHIYIYI